MIKEKSDEKGNDLKKYDKEKFMGIVKSEYMKQRGSFSKKLIVIAPIITILLVLFLMGGRYFQIGSYNWWYVTIFPLAITIICSYIMKNDSKNNFHGLFAIVENKKNIYYGKVILVTIYALVSSLILFILVAIGSLFLKNDISILSCFSGSVLLFLLFIWQIPLWLSLSLKIKVGISVIISFLCNLFLAVILAISPIWWIPFASPARVAAAVLHVLPNGLPTPIDSRFLDKSVIIPALIINLALYFIITYLGAKSFEKGES
ncbi:MAG: lantibiotic immunity ABC transporter MutE/EpiE family permease subunit [Sarcina sp.]